MPSDRYREQFISNLKMFATDTIISKSFNVGSPPAPLNKGGAWKVPLFKGDLGGSSLSIICSTLFRI